MARPFHLWLGLWVNGDPPECCFAFQESLKVPRTLVISVHFRPTQNLLAHGSLLFDLKDPFPLPILLVGRRRAKHVFAPLPFYVRIPAPVFRVWLGNRYVEARLVPEPQ